jgi:Rho GTPase-activating protein 1
MLDEDRLLKTLRENNKHEREIRLPVPQRQGIFGVPLEELMGYDGEKGGVPRVVKDCVEYLRQSGASSQYYPPNRL